MRLPAGRSRVDARAVQHADEPVAVRARSTRPARSGWRSASSPLSAGDRPSRCGARRSGAPAAACPSRSRPASNRRRGRRRCARASGGSAIDTPCTMANAPRRRARTWRAGAVEARARGSGCAGCARGAPGATKLPSGRELRVGACPPAVRRVRCARGRAAASPARGQAAADHERLQIRGDRRVLDAQRRDPAPARAPRAPARVEPDAAPRRARRRARRSSSDRCRRRCGRRTARRCARAAPASASARRRAPPARRRRASRWFRASRPAPRPGCAR